MPNLPAAVFKDKVHGVLFPLPVSHGALDGLNFGVDAYEMGDLYMHSLTTPLVEMAGDGKTALAMWYSLGQVTNASADGSASGSWMHERYAVDFIKENGQWKIWHFFVGTDLGSPAVQPFSLQRGPMGGGVSVPPDGPGKYQVYSRTRVPIEYPKMPVSYKTLDDTFSY